MRALLVRLGTLSGVEGGALGERVLPVSALVAVLNPFTGRTAFAFDVPSGPLATTRIVIRDLLGATVRTLCNAALGAGRHEVIWDGADDHGRAIAPGVYLAEIQRSAQRTVARVALVR